jgi:hypothetical protein
VEQPVSVLNSAAAAPIGAAMRAAFVRALLVNMAVNESPVFGVRCLALSLPGVGGYSLYPKAVWPLTSRVKFSVTRLR